MRITYIQDQEIYQYGSDYYHAKSVHFFTRYLEGLNASEKITVLCGIIKVHNEDEIRKYQKITNNRIIYKKLPDFRSVYNLKAIFTIVKNEVENSDFCYLRCGIASTIAGGYCNLINIPYMSVVNEDIYKNCRASSKRLVRTLAYPLWLGTRYVLKHARYACYVTQDYLQNKYPSKGKTIGCSDVETLELDEHVLQMRMRKISNYNGKKCVIGTAGSVDAFLKAHDVVIKALKILNKETEVEYIYEIIGTGNSNRLKDMAKTEDVEKQVVFLGEMSHEDVLNWMDHLDIYIHPSRSEGLPRTIIEAISRALPCICSDVGGIPELVSYEYLFSYKSDELPDNELAKLIKRMDKSEMEKQALINFEKAHKYAPELLSLKRKEFFERSIAAERE